MARTFNQDRHHSSLGSFSGRSTISFFWLNDCHFRIPAGDPVQCRNDPADHGGDLMDTARFRRKFGGVARLIRGGSIVVN